jgi:hypothetical protein
MYNKDVKKTENETNGAEHLKLKHTTPSVTHTHSRSVSSMEQAPSSTYIRSTIRAQKTGIDHRRCCPSRNTDAEYISPEPPDTVHGYSQFVR